MKLKSFKLLNIICLQDADVLVSVDHPVHRGRPWTQQSQSCGRPGDFVYLPRSFLGTKPNDKTGMKNVTEEELQRLASVGVKVRDQFLRYRFGVFDSPGRSEMTVGSRQHALCMGRTVEEVVAASADMTMARMLSAAATKRRKNGKHKNMDPVQRPPPPIRFGISARQPPRYMLVLENSLAMDGAPGQAHWDLVRRAVKKFVTRDAEPEARVGLVLFSEGAYVAHPAATEAGPPGSPARQAVAVGVGNKYSLVNKNGSCVRCGVLKAIEGMQGGGGGRRGVVGGSVIIVSQVRKRFLSISK